MGKLAVLVVVGGLVAAFWYDGSWLSHDEGTAPRPSGVPAEAVWTRGTAGAEWIACRPAIRAGVFACEIYDSSGFELHTGNYAFMRAPGAAGGDPEIRYREGDVIRAANGDLAPSGRHIEFSRDGRETQASFPVRTPVL
jgi:hypothetical protein